MARRRAAAPAERLVQAQRLDDLLADRIDRVQRAHRLLEDHGDLGAAQPLHRARAFLGEVADLAVAGMEQDLAPRDTARGRRDQPHDGEARHRFAGARFADDHQGFAAPHLEGYAGHGLDRAGVAGEFDTEVAHLEERSAHAPRRGSKWSRKASPRRLKPSTRRKMARPGKVAIHQAVRK